MANARITRSLSGSSAFAAEVTKLAARKTAAKMDEVARLATQKFDEIVAAEFVNDRAPDRRRTGRHLLGSSNARVLGDPSTFPVTVSIGSTAQGKKLGALEYGSPPHVIPGPVVFDVAFKHQKGVPAAEQVKAGRFQAAYGKGGSVRAPSVNHPGNRPHHMMKRALEAAIQQVYGLAVKARAG